MELSIIVPCYDEEENITPLLERIEAALADFEGEGHAYEIILVDDGSTDRTGERIEAAAATDSHVVACHHERNRGIVAGWRTGLSVARGRFVLTTDADLQYRPEDIPTLYRTAIETGADLVQGWRREHREGSRLRIVLSLGLSHLLNLLFGMRLKDIKSGFILYRRPCFEKILAYRGNYRHFQHFITIAAHAHGFSIRQIPIVFEKRHAGASFIQAPLRFSLEALHDIPIALWEYRFQRRRLEGTRGGEEAEEAHAGGKR
ncbi:MAG: glycosyltransferase family 2 protein [Deltaproteobacteria bacterium]|nr:MAG: glycosyltransferase family 2 protein [Deltaproteobacteria bacterium]